MKHDAWLVLVGLIGLGAVTFTACSSSTDDASGVAGAAGADAAGASSVGGSTADAGSTTVGGSTSSAGATTASCTTSASTAANTAAVVAAAEALTAALTVAQETAIQYDATLLNAQQWSNLPTTAIPRNGVMLGDLSASALEAALALVDVAAGTTGSTMFAELRAADEWLVSDGKAQSDSYGEGRYYIAFVGTPSTSTPWQLQIAGHHLAYNFTYNGRCTSASPLFLGVEPVSWTDGSTEHTPMEAQRAASVAVIEAIADDADSLLEGTFTDVVNGPSNVNSKGDAKYPTALSYPTGSTGRGVLVGSLSVAKQALVKTAIEAWVKNVADPIATALLVDYESDSALAETYVAYSGGTDLTTKNDYFRIDGPRVWIEFTIQGGIVYQKVHFHTLWRDKEADYGAEFIDEDATDTSTGTGGPGSGGPPGM